MFQFKPQRSKTGTVPHLSYEPRKPKKLGIEVKNAADGETGVMPYLEIIRGKASLDYHLSFGFIF